MRCLTLFFLLLWSVSLSSQTHKVYDLADISSEVFSFKVADSEVFAFTAIAIRLEKKLPETSKLWLRSSPNGQTWTEWESIPKNKHTAADVQIFGQLNKPAEQRFFQVKATEQGELKGARIELYSPTEFVGKSPAEPKQHAQNQADGNLCPCLRPAYVDRAAWGGPAGQQSGCTPGYTNVSHIIIHHEASIPQPPYDAAVKSIWQFHTGSNNWCDIAYNWLIAPDGVLYEGRAGGDNVLGAHFCGDNANTMGVCLMGNFEIEQPTPAALKTLEKLLAWKTCQENIDPQAVSVHLGSGAVLPNISGHRAGCATLCPGENLYTKLDSIRAAVAHLKDDPTGCDGIYPPANDNCAQAQTLTTDATLVTGTVLGASASNAPILNCSGFVSPTALDVWYKFVAISPTAEILIRPDNVSSAGLDVVMALYEGTCANLDSIRCVDPPGMPTAFLNTVGPLTVGASYFIRIYDYGATQPTIGGFKISVSQKIVETKEPLNRKTVRIFPNPAQKAFSIDFDDKTLNQFDIQVVNTLGQQVFSQKQANQGTQINCSNWPTGMYLVQFRANSGFSLTLPLIKVQ